VIGDGQQDTEQQEHEHTLEQKCKAREEVNGIAIDERKEQTADEVRDGFTARQERERLAELVFTDQFTDERFGAGDDESAWTPDHNRQIDQPTVLTVGHHCQTKDLEYDSDDGKTEVAEMTETNEAGEEDGRSQTETGVVSG